MKKQTIIAALAILGMAALAEPPRSMPYTVPFEKQYRVISGSSRAMSIAMCA